MGLSSTPDAPPPDCDGHLAYVMWIARECHGLTWAEPYSAFEQDLRISGDDVDYFIENLENRYGDWVWTWPWQRFAQTNEGLSALFPVILIWQLATWPFRGSFEYPTKFERLELRHIAKILEAGEWVEP